jgi:hypothetical protein
MTFLSLFLLILVALGAGATTLSIIISTRSSREARSTIFPIVREEERARSLRARITSILFLVVTALALAGWLATQRDSPMLVVVRQPQPTEPQSAGPSLVTSSQSEDVPTVAAADELATPIPLPPTPTSQPTSTEAALRPTATRSPTPAPTTPPPATPAPVPGDAPLVTGTVVFTGTGGQPLTAQPPVTSTEPITATVSALPTVSRTLEPPPPGAELGPITFALEITDRREAIKPSTVFSAPVDSLYAVYPYDGMLNGLIFTAVWYHNGLEFLRSEQEWEWGSRDRSYTFASLVGHGTYTLELLINDTVVTTGTFRVD